MKKGKGRRSSPFGYLTLVFVLTGAVLALAFCSSRPQPESMPAAKPAVAPANAFEAELQATAPVFMQIKRQCPVDNTEFIVPSQDKLRDNKLGGYAPTFGIIGTVLGLIHTLESLGGDPAELGHLIAAAFIATLFGVLFANAIYLPIGAKMQAIGDQEAEARLLVLEGVKWIAEGKSPRQIREMLPRFLEPAERPTDLKKSA